MSHCFDFGVFYLSRGLKLFLISRVYFVLPRVMNPNFLRSALLLVGLVSLTVSCKTRNQPHPPVEPAPVPPAQYGQLPGGEIPAPPECACGRFGYTGTNPAPGATAPAPAPGPAPAPPAPGPGMRDVRDIGGVTPPATDTKPTPPPSSTPSSDMPYANAVPGNPLVVTLPGANASLGQISVEKYDSSGNPTGEPLKRGTQVQIPDPNNPGKKIYFKVP